MMRLRFLHAVWMTLGALLAGSGAHAEEIYRCPGNLYQQSPCPGGTRLEIDPETNRQKMPSPQSFALDLAPARAWVGVIPMPPRMEVSAPPVSQPRVDPWPDSRGPFPFPHRHWHRHEHRPPTIRHSPPPQERPRYPATRIMR